MPLKLQTIINRLETGREVTIAALGDSLTVGWCVQKGYFERFLDGLSEKYPRAIIRRINAGVSGNTVFDGAMRLGSVLAKRPDLLLVQFGINDCWQDMGASRYGDGLTKLVAAILDAPTVVPLLVTSCPVLDPAFQFRLSMYYDLIGQLAKREDLDFCDIADYWASLGTAPEQYLEDGVHPSDAGYQVMANALLRLF